jgi:hypothetical protein
VGPTRQREKGESEEGRWLGLGKKKWAGLAHAGEEERREEARGERETGLGQGEGLGCLSFILSPLLFFFYTPLIRTNLIEFKIQFEFKSINSTQLKKMLPHECTNMLLL